MSFGLNRIARKNAAREADKARQVEKVDLIYEGANPVQRELIDDKSLYIGAVCPRRSGKTFSVVSKALHLGESKPGARILIISLTLKSTVENYWSGAPGGLFSQNYRYDLGLTFNTTQHTWVHQNGSRGLLAGAETKADIEHLRGAAAEADLIVIDECKSFAPSHLEDLIENVVEPGLMTRNGQLIMIGTPGSIPLGPFYEATCLRARVGECPTPEACAEHCPHVRPTCIQYQHKAVYRTLEGYGGLTEAEVEDLFSLHMWTIQDNLAAPHQWARALKIKVRRGWADDHPTWRREYLGEWVNDSSDLVYAYMKARAAGTVVNWVPQAEFGVTGLDPKQGPWHLLMGIDLGFVDASAMVVVAYSEQLKELRQVHEFKRPELDSQAFIEEVLEICAQFPELEYVVADYGGGGAKMLLETLNQRYGMSIMPAEKKSKNDHIDLLNGDFLTGRIKILAKSDLEIELCGLQWDLSNDAKMVLARTGRLREDPQCPNHLCDAFLYIWRFAHHFWASPFDQGPPPGTPEWIQAQEDAAIERYIQRRRLARTAVHPQLAKLAATRPPDREQFKTWPIPRPN